MIAVWQKIRADITGRPVISVLVLATIAASATLLMLALATLANISAPYDRAFEVLNAAHVWLYFERDRVGPREIGRVEALPGVVESTGLRYNVLNRVRIHDTWVWVSLQAIPAEQPDVNRLLVEEGRYLVPGQEELLASKDLDDIYGLAVGETVSVARQDGKRVELPIVGLAYNPMWDTYRGSQPPYIYLTEETLRRLFPDDSLWDWSMGLRLVDPHTVDETVALVEGTLRSGAVKSHTDWRDVKESAAFSAQLNFVFLGAFGLFAVFATVLVVASTIGSVVLNQFKQIGTLKAIGFTSLQIMWLYLGQYLILCLLGSTLGMLLGFVLSPLPLKNVAASLATPYRPLFSVPLATMVIVAMLGVVTLASLGAAYQGAQANTIQSIAVGVEAPRKKVSWWVRLAARLGLPPTLLLGLNDVSARPFRSLVIGVNLTLGVMGIVFGLALSETLDAYEDNPALLGIAFDAFVTREETSNSRTQYLLRAAPGVEGFYGQYLVEAETLDGESFQIRAVEGDLWLFPFKLDEGRLLDPNRPEAIAGRGLLDWLGLEVGDNITLALEGRESKPVTWQIVGQYPEAANAGQMLMVGLPTVKRVFGHLEPDTYFLRLSPDCDSEQLGHYLKPRPDADLTLVLVEQLLPDDVFYLELAIFALSGLLISIALVNVFNASWLAMQEKLRSIGVLKAVGMTPTQIMMMVSVTAGFLGLLATVFGVPLGLLFVRGLTSALATGYGFGKVNVTLSGFRIACLVPVVGLISMAGSFIPGRWAARVSVVSVLRAE